MSKKTVILGASPNTSRYAYLAAQMLTDYGHEIVPVSVKRGSVLEKEILDVREKPDIPNVDTITMYVGGPNQQGYYDYILGLKPSRIIFNPGSENPELAMMAKERGIEVVEGCTLVMLRTGAY